MTFDKHLIFVRHSLVDRVDGVPARKWNLSGTGRIRARGLVDKLIEFRPEVIVSSDEPKAEQTAEIVSECLGLKYSVEKNLHEHDRRQVPYLTNDEFQSLVQEFFTKPDTLVFGNETANQALLRFRGAVNLVLDSSDTKTILIVSHGTVISLFVSWLTGQSGYSFWKELGLPSFVVLDLQSKTLLHLENSI